MLNIIEGYDFSDIPFGSAKHTLSTKLKLVLKTGPKYYADMNFVKVPVQQLLSKEYGDKEETDRSR
jgi:gamma-glutamyltranspeptidase/glutathione hydrolase